MGPKVICKFKCVKDAASRYFISQWNKQWSGLDTCRQSKRFWPAVNVETSKFLLKLSKKQLNKITQLVTGHGFNNYHLNLKDPSRDPNCRFCGEEVEDSWHLVMECHHFNRIRFETVAHGRTSIRDLLLPDDLVHLPKLICHLADVFVDRHIVTAIANRDGSPPPNGTAQ